MIVLLVDLGWLGKVPIGVAPDHGQSTILILRLKTLPGRISRKLCLLSR